MQAGLQCDPDKAGWEHILDFEFFEAFACTYTNVAGFFVTGMIVWGGVAIAIYATTDDVRIPAVLTFLLGGLLIPTVAGPAVTIAALIVMLSGAGVLTYLYYKYSR